MKQYPDSPPRHSHRSPSELAEDDILAALRGEYCGAFADHNDRMPEWAKERIREGTRSTPIASPARREE